MFDEHHSLPIKSTEWVSGQVTCKHLPLEWIITALQINRNSCGNWIMVIYRMMLFLPLLSSGICLWNPAERASHLRVDRVDGMLAGRNGLLFSISDTFFLPPRAISDRFNLHIFFFILTFMSEIFLNFIPAFKVLPHNDMEMPEVVCDSSHTALY